MYEQKDEQTSSASVRPLYAFFMAPAAAARAFKKCTLFFFLSFLNFYGKR